MSVELNYPFTTPANYTYSNKIDISGGIASITLNQIDADFTEDFADDTDFTYDNTLAEFTGGLVQQIDKTPQNETFFSSYTTDINGTRGLGNLTGTGSGSPVITGGKLDLTAASQQYVDYDADINADSQQTGCIRWKYTPNYSGSPTNIQYMICISRGNNDGRNLIQVYHSNNGQLYIYIKDLDGNTIYQAATGAWSPVASTEYEFEFDYAFSAPPAQRLFIDGTVFATRTNLATRDANINLLRIGENVNPVSQSDFSIDDLQIFSTVQHTSNYTPTLAQQTKYLESSVILPEMEHTGDGTIKLFNSFSTTEVGSPHYTLQIGRSGDYLYWNGSAWVVSDGSYSQANTQAVFNSNCTSLDVSGENYGQFKIIFPDSDIQNLVSELTANMNIDIYYTDNPIILVNAEFRLEALEEFVETATKTNSEIKYILKRAGTWVYWNGSSWSESDQTYTQANTATEIHTNKATFTTIGVQSQLMIFLHSDNGENTPLLDNIQILYDFSGEEPEEIELCTVWGYHYDNDGNPDSESFSVYLSEEQSKYKTQTTIKREVLTVTPDSQGYWEVELVENANMETGIQYVFDFGNGEIFVRTVPNEDYKNYYELTG